MTGQILVKHGRFGVRLSAGPGAPPPAPRAPVKELVKQQLVKQQLVKQATARHDLCKIDRRPSGAGQTSGQTSAGQTADRIGLPAVRPA